MSRSEYVGASGAWVEGVVKKGGLWSVRRAKTSDRVLTMFARANFVQNSLSKIHKAEEKSDKELLEEIRAEVENYLVLTMFSREFL